MVSSLVDSREDHDAGPGHRNGERDHRRPTPTRQPAQMTRLRGQAALARPVWCEVRLRKISRPDSCRLVGAHGPVTRASPCATETAKPTGTESAASRTPPAP